MIFNVFSIQMHRDINLTIGQPRVIFWTNLVELEFPKPCPKIQQQSFHGSEKEEFMRAWRPSFFNTPWPFVQIFSPTLTQGSTWSLRKLAQMRSRSKVWTDRRTYGRRPGSDHNSSSWVFGSGLLKMAPHLYPLASLSGSILYMINELNSPLGPDKGLVSAL